jgi:hypothetical protein
LLDDLLLIIDPLQEGSWLDFWVNNPCICSRYFSVGGFCRISIFWWWMWDEFLDLAVFWLVRPFKTGVLTRSAMMYRSIL